MTRQRPKRRRVVLWTAVVLALAATVFFIVRSAAPPPQTPAPKRSTVPTGNTAEQLAVAPTDRVKGNPNATVTLVEYSDFQCPACGSYYPIVQRVVQDFGDRIRFVYRHYPLVNLHANAHLAARAAEAAGRQGKFWEMHDRLFEQQGEWAEKTDARARFIGFAKDLGLVAMQFEADLDAPEVKEAVAAGLNSGFLLAVPGTPTFFLAGVPIENPKSYDEFRTVILQAIGRP